MSRLALNAPVLPWAVVLVVGILIWDAWFRQPAAEPVTEQTYKAVVVSEPAEKPKTVGVELLILPSQERITCYIHKDERSRQMALGDGLTVTMRLQNRSYVPAGNWQKASFPLQQLSLVERCRLRCLQFRHQLLLHYRQEGIEGAAYGVIAAMTLGDRSALTPEVRETFNVTGATHVLALSGLHLGIIYSLLSLLVVGRRFRVLSQLLIVVAIWAFAFLVGLPSSVVRSATMLSIYALLSLGARKRMSVNVLALTAVCMLAVRPLVLFDVGFQLSFLAVLGILLWVPLFEGLVSARFMQGHPVVRWLWGLFTVSFAAQLAVAPLIAYYFGRFPPYFLLTNLVVIPATTLILYVSLFMLVVPSVAAPVLVALTWLLTTWLGALSRLPLASIDGLHPSALTVVVIYAVILAANLWLRQKAVVRR